MTEHYYVYADEGVVHRIAKIENGSAYAYEHGKWIPMSGLIDIQFEVTDFEEISEAEANYLGEKYFSKE